MEDKIVCVPRRDGDITEAVIWRYLNWRTEGPRNGPTSSTFACSSARNVPHSFVRSGLSFHRTIFQINHRDPFEAQALKYRHVFRDCIWELH
jgi:hypothetical protein